ESRLQLVPRPRKQLRERMLRMADHPAEDLGRGRERGEGGPDRRRAAPAVGSARGERRTGCRCEQERADQMRAAALVLLLGGLATLVGADRDVLGAVVGRELAPAERERRRRERDDSRDELLRRR